MLLLEKQWSSLPQQRSFACSFSVSHESWTLSSPSISGCGLFWFCHSQITAFSVSLWAWLARHFQKTALQDIPHHLSSVFPTPPLGYSLVLEVTVLIWMSYVEFFPLFIACWLVLHCAIDMFFMSVFYLFFCALTNVERSLLCGTNIFRSQFDIMTLSKITMAGRNLELFDITIVNFWTGLSLKQGIPYCGKGLRSNQNMVCYSPILLPLLKYILSPLSIKIYTNIYIFYFGRNRL